MNCTSFKLEIVKTLTDIVFRDSEVCVNYGGCISNILFTMWSAGRKDSGVRCQAYGIQNFLYRPGLCKKFTV